MVALVHRVEDHARTPLGDAALAVEEAVLPEFGAHAHPQRKPLMDRPPQPPVRKEVAEPDREHPGAGLDVEGDGCVARGVLEGGRRRRRAERGGERDHGCDQGPHTRSR